MIAFIIGAIALFTASLILAAVIGGRSLTSTINPD